ncbi:hypothetical protein FDENT_13604 [Fusarium denticulatum]|uniref:Uncharacterized protein n=1 Tax=Fusarium denticulatum TaxID=48507 RepID=A0A8H5WIA4_9HYPO|nr:hypothetical protein FDENT_13604 [Fusarium denticulatum]
MHRAVHNVLRKLHDQENDMDEGHDPIVKHQGITSSELQHDLKLATMEMVVLDDLVPAICELANKTTAKVNELSGEGNLRDLIEKRECAERIAEDLKSKHEAALEKLKRLKQEEDAFHAKPAAYFLGWNQDLRAMYAEGSRCDGEIFDSDMEEEGSGRLDMDVEMGVASVERDDEPRSD